MIHFRPYYPVNVVRPPRPVRPDARYGVPLAGVGATLEEAEVALMAADQRGALRPVDITQQNSRIISYTGDPNVDRQIEATTDGEVPGMETGKKMLTYLAIGGAVLFAVMMLKGR